MSDTEMNTADASEKWEATLKMGLTYTFGGVKFEKDVARPVDAGTKAALEERAIDHKIIGDEYEDDGTAVTEPRQKFVFNRVGEEPTKARTRTRAATR